jgi:signal transduction histidine kinase
MSHPIPARAHLTRGLTVVMDVMSAQAAALFLFDSGSGELVASAATGAAQDGMVRFLGALDPMPQITELDTDDALGREGIAMVLGVPLASEGPLRGMVYIGLRERRVFTSADARHVSELCGFLSLQLDNARLDVSLRKKIDELESESKLRERFITLLMHDLDAPLSAARANALLLSHQDQPRAVRVFGVAIAHSIEQVDRMVGDLLDTHRIRAGQSPPMALTDCNLSALVRESLEEMHAVYGDRFLLRADRSVRGIWSASQLRRAIWRAIWNLCSNAVKYGAEDAPVSLSVASHSDGAELTVHNEGPPIPVEEQDKLFKPFSSDRGAIDGHPRGWGLGMTLIWGCAEAHGGRVSVVSELDKGTTFRLVIPCDARPYAE